jgi:mono/diheme cytochrome c family protein
MMKWYISLGTLSVFGLVAIFGYLAVTELQRMADFTVAFRARQIEAGAGLFENNCRICHGVDGKGIEGVAPALNAADLFSGQRLQTVGYAGTVEDYVRSVISAGRPVPSAGTTYPNRMPTWGERFGGPMRDDQIDALVAFIMNWEERALAEATPAPTLSPDQAAGTDITRELPEGDAARGQQLAEGPLGCTACHILSGVGPGWLPAAGFPGMGERAETRLAEPGYTGRATTAAQYLFEAVVLPDEHVVEGFQPGVMPRGFGNRLTPQDLADLIAYMLSLR